MTNFLFATKEFEKKAPRNKHQFFIMAYWKAGWWKIFPDLYLDAGFAKEKMGYLAEKGWSHITLIKLPELGE